MVCGGTILVVDVRAHTKESDNFLFNHPIDVQTIYVIVARSITNFESGGPMFLKPLNVNPGCIVGTKLQLENREFDGKEIGSAEFSHSMVTGGGEEWSNNPLHALENEGRE